MDNNDTAAAAEQAGLHEALRPSLKEGDALALFLPVIDQDAMRKLFAAPLDSSNTRGVMGMAATVITYPELFETGTVDAANAVFERLDSAASPVHLSDREIGEIHQDVVAKANVLRRQRGLPPL